MTKKTKAEVYIIESLKLKEEDTHREGEILFQALTLAGKSPKYRYIRTKREFDEFLDEFDDSNYRYLHISCHGNKDGIATTFDDISTSELAGMVGPVLHERRLFLSACEATTSNLADEILKHGEPYSIVGPVDSIRFDDSVVLWTTFYHLMFKADTERMTAKRLRLYIRLCATMLDEKFNVFSLTEAKKLRHTLVGPVKKLGKKP